MMTQETRRSIEFSLLALAFLGTLAIAQTTDPGTGLERQSKPGELQSKPKAVRRKGVAMTPGRPAVTTGLTTKMEEQLDRPVAAGSGERQPAVNREQASEPAKGRGEQQAPQQKITPAQTHLHLVLRISADGKAEVVTATEVPGPASLSDDVMGDTFYALSLGSRILAVQSIPDPFETRSFAPKDSPQQGHYFGRAKEALVVVKVPNTSLAATSLQSLTLRLYKLSPGMTIQKINPAVFNQLNQQKKLEMRIEVPARTLAPQIKAVGRKLDVQQ
jgi:hypothetical protein